MKYLRWLYISQNNIEDISPISKLENLETVYMDGNPIKDYSVLDQLKDTDIITGLN